MARAENRSWFCHRRRVVTDEAIDFAKLAGCVVLERHPLPGHVARRRVVLRLHFSAHKSADKDWSPVKQAEVAEQQPASIGVTRRLTQEVACQKIGQEESAVSRRVPTRELFQNPENWDTHGLTHNAGQRVLAAFVVYRLICNELGIRSHSLRDDHGAL